MQPRVGAAVVEVSHARILERAIFLGLRAPARLLPLVAFVLAAVWRLSYFNIHDLDMTTGRPCFVGLCTTHAAAILLGCTTLAHRVGADLTLVVPLAFGLLALLMVSGLRVPKNGLFMASLYVTIPLCVVANLFR